MRSLTILLGWFLSLVLGITAPVALGQQTTVPDTSKTLDLQALLEEVRANNPALRASRLETKALATRRLQVSALPDPEVTITYQPFPLLTARGTQRTQWRVEQMIPYPGKLGLQGDIADLSTEIAGFEAETFEQNLLFQVKWVYYELYRIQQQETLIRSFQDQLRGFEQAAAIQYEVGRGMQQSILKAQLERNTLSQTLLSLTRQRQTAAKTLARLLNRPPSVDVLADIRVESPPLPELDEAALFEIALEEHPEVDALSLEIERAEAEIDLARRQFLPDFGLNLTYFDVGASDVPATATGQDALAIGASVKVPLQRGRLRARLEEAQVRRAQIELEMEAHHTMFRTRIADLISGLRQETRQLALYREALFPQAEATLEATLNAYTTGRTDFLNLLDAERMLFSLRTGYEDTFARYLKGTAALERALGIASLADLDTL